MRITIDMGEATKAFNAGVNYLSKLTGLDRRKVILSEAGSILKACAVETKVAKVSDVEKAVRLRVLRHGGYTRGGSVTINAGVKADYGRVFLRKKDGSGYRRTHDANFQPLNYHYRDEDWDKIEAAIAESKGRIAIGLPKGRQSAALARQSWVLIADSLGISLEQTPGGRISAASIAKARDAKARNNAQTNNGLGVIESNPQRFLVTLINRLPYGQRIGFERLLAAKVSGRAQLMQAAVQHGFDGSAKNLAKSFPGWIVKSN